MTNRRHEIRDQTFTSCSPLPAPRSPHSALRRIGYVALLLLLATIGCGPDEALDEQPTFTRERPSFTEDRSDSAASAIRFTDVTAAAGIDFVHENGAFGEKWMPETMGSGGGFLDYDGDGAVDLLLVNGAEWPGHESGSTRPTPRLYRNRGDGTFEDVTERAGLSFTLYGMGAAFADYDGDGDTDVYLTAVGDNRLLRNDGGRFTDVTRTLGVAGGGSRPGETPDWSTGAVWVDVDRDGWLDLFVANYVRWTPETDIYVTRDGKTKSYATPEGYEGETCRLYRNVGGTRFEDVTEAAGLFNDEGKSLGVAVADFNDDGWPDLVVANDTQPNFLYLNDGDGTFTDQAIPAGLGYDEIGRARAGMGVDVADVSNDGRLAVAIGNFSGEPLSLYTQIGNGDLFQDRAGAARLTRPTLLALTFGVRFVDLDLDGYQDLLAVNGHIEPAINDVQQDVTFAQPPLVFRNREGRFVDVSAQAGAPFTKPIVARGVATADVDRDGDLDVLVTVNDGPVRLLRNELGGANWVRIRLEGHPPNREAVGARVTLWSGGMPQRRFVRTGSSYLTQSDHRELIFGLGESMQADSILVHWPTTGAVSRRAAVPTHTTYVFKEPS